MDGLCKPCGGDPKKCCLNGECKDCCKSSTTGNCEAWNNECGCDPPGPSAGCADKMKSWTVGVTHFCWSECGGTPCDYILSEVPCYAWRKCKEGAKHWFQECSPGEEFTYDNCIDTTPLPMYCQDCVPYDDAVVVEAYDCSCP